jgi:outer membrane protein TolC
MRLIGVSALFFETRTGHRGLRIQSRKASPERQGYRFFHRLPALGIVALAGCAQTLLDRTDRSVYRLVEQRQKDALGATANASLGEVHDPVRPDGSMYEFVPRPVSPEVPEEFQRRPPTDRPTSNENARTEPAAHKTADTDTSPEDAPGAELPQISPDIFDERDAARLQTFRLSDALRYAMRHSREVQDAKEELYLAALDLTLERHLWTPLFVGSVQAEYANYGQVRDFDHAMSAVSEVAVTQRLPWGGEVAARVINSLMRDLGRHITSGESGNVILEANLPLFRRAGRVAFESRYAAERELIYAVRTFEDFRRSFTVLVAASYFDLQQRKAAIANAFTSYASLREEWLKADFVNRLGRSRTVFDAPRARSSFRRSEATLVSAKEQYASALDRFKIVLGMPVNDPLDVVPQEDDQESGAFEALLAEVDEIVAIDTALKLRLDLLTAVDRVDDAKRGVLIARNRILPDLEISGSVTLDSDPEQLNSTSYNLERLTWRGMAELRMDDRKTERNAYRASLITLRRAERAQDQLADTVRADVRRALRRIAQQRNLLQIQAMNVEENELRLRAAQAQYDLGKITNQDVVDADTDLLAARNQYADAVAEYRNAILEFRRDTATLRVDDDGHWAGLGP